MFEHAPPGYVCPFCLLTDGAFGDPRLLTLAADVVLRSDEVMAIVSPHWWPNNPGHVLVVPTEHHENLYTLPPRQGLAVFEASQRVAIAMKQAYRCDGVSTRQHNEPAGNQDVWHYHLHVFPRWTGDELYANHAHRLDLAPPEERARHAALLRDALAGSGDRADEGRH
jgi:histidine triad (HIT) family protein